MHVRVAPEGFARRSLTVAVLLCALTGCSGAGTGDQPRVDWTLDPSAPSETSDARVRLIITDRNGAPVTGATLRIEAHMSHPGMTPVVTTATEQRDGTYEAGLQFSMAGRWSLVATGTLPDGRRLVTQLHAVEVEALR